jgi:hypothetical protein
MLAQETVHNPYPFIDELLSAQPFVVAAGQRQADHTIMD